LIEVRVELLAGPRRGSGLCLIDGAVAALDLPGLDGPTRVPASVVPGWLAGLVGVGPRPEARSPGVLLAPRTLVDCLTGADAAAVRAAVGRHRVPPAWIELLVGIAASLPARWRMSVGAPADVPVDLLEILDAGDCGLWSVQDCPPELLSGEGREVDAAEPWAVLTPTTPTAVWVWLSRLAGYQM
jgi:hypothetical protein